MRSQFLGKDAVAFEDDDGCSVTIRVRPGHPQDEVLAMAHRKVRRLADALERERATQKNASDVYSSWVYRN